MTRHQVKQLSDALKKRFGGKVDFEAVNGKGRYRFAVTTKRFDDVPHLKRQDAIWEVVDEVLSREAKLGISLILAYAPKDLILAKQ